MNGTARGGDLRYVGVASTAPEDPDNAVLGFGLATWRNWYNIGSNTIPFVDIETTFDGIPDFEVFVNRDADTDLLEAWTVDLNTGDLVDIEPVNQLYGDVDSNVFDTNVIVLPVFLEALGIDPTADTSRISYFVGVAGFYTPPDSTLVDFIPSTLTFDPLQPGLRAEGADSGLIHVAEPGASFTVHRNADAAAQDPSDSLLVLNFHNGTGSKASVIKVK